MKPYKKSGNCRFRIALGALIIAILFSALAACDNGFVEAIERDIKGNEPAPSFSVIFEKNDPDATGTMTPQSIVSGKSDFLYLCTFTKTGWTFLGWALTADGPVEYSNGDNFTIGSDDVYLYAKWAENLTLTFNKNDLDATGTMNDQVIPGGTTASLEICTFEKEGWTFIGWAIEPTGSVTYSDGEQYDMGSSNVTLYAKWSANNYSVSFDKNDEDAIGSMPDQSIASGSTESLDACTYSKTGWSFSGWSTTSSGSVEYSDGSDYTMGSSDITLYAVWNVNTYTVTFDSEGGSAPVPSSIEVEYGDAYGTLATTNKTGYSFAGWFTESGGGDQITAASSLTNPVDHSLYANWEINEYSLSYNGNGNTGGSVPATTSHDYNSTVTVAGNTGDLVKSQDGISLILVGWNTEADGTGTTYSLGSGSFTMGASNITLYAKWTALGASGPAGGYVFYDKGSYSDGWRYMEAAPSDQSTGVQWYNGSYVNTDTHTWAIGEGENSTNTIVSIQGSGTYAAKICQDLTSGGYSDWFLPTRDELHQMYVNLKSRGIGGFSDDYYWSTSEQDSSHAGRQRFEDGFQGYWIKSDSTESVRAARYF